MNYTKRVMMIAALSAALSIGGSLLPDRTSASPMPVKTKEAQQSSLPSTAEALFVNVLGAESADDVKESLYNGASLADIASQNGNDVQPVIALQVFELALQLQERLAAGSISQQQYEDQLAELPELVTSSVYTPYH